MQHTQNNAYHLKIQAVMQKIDLLNAQLAVLHHVEYKQRKRLLARRSELYKVLQDLKYQARYQ